VDAINAEAPTWELIGFLDDARPQGTEYLGLPVLGPVRRAARVGADCSFINAIGSDRSYPKRPEIIAATGLDRARFATLVHPGASVSARSRLGCGVLVNHGVSLGGWSVIGDHVTLSPGCIVGHDTTIEDYGLIAPGAIISGFVHVGRNSYVGAGASIRQLLRIGEQALIGMGAVVIREVAAKDCVVGSPARPLNRRAEDHRSS
jgi:sugar O-acyltransferase (sialic acid O-acetyltransferase NeuD family)